MTVTLYSQYFSHNLSKRLGRRINRNAAKNFNVDRLKEILSGMNVKYEVREGHYPRVPWENSKIFFVETDLKKSSLLKIIERRLS
jgi:signal recognition particle subunit SRP19